MHWKDLVGPLAKIGLPTIGTLIGGPAGGAIGKVIADTLGTEETPEAVSAAIEAKPETAAAQLSQPDTWARIMEAQASVAKEQVTQVNETIRTEVAAQAARPDGWWGNWRTWLAYMLVVECPVWVFLIVWCVLQGKINELVLASGLIMTWWGARFGVLGVHVWTGSQERRTAITGERSGSVLQTVTTAIAKSVSKK